MPRTLDACESESEALKSYIQVLQDARSKAEQQAVMLWHALQKAQKPAPAEPQRHGDTPSTP
jgi:hypothetical protein